MRAGVARVFRLHEGEAVPVVLLATFGGLLQAGVSIGVSAADAVFLARLGAERLAYVYLALPLVTVVVTLAYAWSLERFGLDRTLEAVLSSTIVGGVLFSFGLGDGEALGSAWLVYAIEIYANLFVIVVFTIYWTYVEGHFDILSAKRLFPVLTGGTALGGMLGGAAVPLLLEVTSVGGLFLVWSIVSTGALALLGAVRRHFPTVDEGDDDDPSLLEQWRAVTATFRTSAYVRALNAGVLLLMFASILCEYQYYSILETYGDEAELASLFGWMLVGVGLFNLVINFFLFGRLVAAVGVRNTAVIQPLVYTSIFVWLVLDQSFAAAVVAFFAYNGLQDAVEDNNWNLVLNPVPRRIVRHVRAFVEGIVDPLGSALGGLFLLVFASPLGASLLGLSLSAHEIAAVGLAVALLYLLTTLRLRSTYLPSMVENLRADWLDFSGRADPLFASIDEGTRENLTTRALDAATTDPTTPLRMLAAADRVAAANALLARLAREPVTEESPLLDLLDEMLLSGDEGVLRAIVAWIQLPDLVLRPALVRRLGRRGIVPPEPWRRWLDSPDPDERSAACVALARTSSLEANTQAARTLQTLVGAEGEDRVHGIRALGCSGQERHAFLLAPLLRDGSPTIRREALRAIGALVTPDGGALVPELIARVRSLDRTTRHLALEALARIDDSTAVRELLGATLGFSPAERRELEALVHGIGLRSVPESIAVLRDSGQPYEGRSIAARTVARLAFPQLRRLVEDLTLEELRRAYRYLAHHHRLAEARLDGPGVQTLARFYLDAQGEILRFVLELLALGGQLADHELIVATLRSRSRKERANAVEALEQACPRRLFRLLLPLVDDRPIAERLTACPVGFVSLPADATAVLDGAVRSRRPLERAAAVQALWDAKDPRAADLSRTLLAEVDVPVVRATVASLLIRGGGAAVPNEIERVAMLLSAPTFRSLGVADLAGLAVDVVPRQVPAGERVYRRGDPADAVFVVAEGRVAVEDDQRVTERGPGSTLGEEVLRQATQYETDARSLGASVLVVERRVLEAAARRSDRVALALVDARLGVGR